MSLSRKPTHEDTRLGRLVQELRKKAGKTQADLARDLGITQQQLGKYQRGESGLRIVTAAKISNAVGVPGRVFFDVLQPTNGFAEGAVSYGPGASPDQEEFARSFNTTVALWKRLTER